MLLEAGVDPNIADRNGSTALVLVVNQDSPEIVKLLLSGGVDVNRTDNDGHTALMWATYSEVDNPLLVRSLIDKGADVNAVARDGATALSWARKKGETATVKLLERSVARR
jgi:ankyrin repeat protein